MDNIKLIDEELFFTKFPNNNKKVYINLNSNEKDIYLKLYSVYSSLLINYFIKKFNLKEYDNALYEMNIGIKKIEEEKMDIYQFLSSPLLDYYYIRNNIFIERLSQEDINYLSNIYKSQNYTLDQEKEAFIERTYLEIILEEPNVTNHFFNYGPNSKEYYHPTNAIVIGVRFDDYFDKDNPQWPKKYMEQLNTITNTNLFLENYIKKLNLPVPVRIVKYDDYSVKKIVQINQKR